MCKFHQDVALDIAQTADGSFDPLAFNINALALGTNFYIDTYTPTMPGISGYHIYALASKKGQDAFANSGLVYDPHAFEAYRHDTIGFLRERTAQIMEKHQIDVQILKKIGQENKAIRFLNAIPDSVYAPFSDLSTDLYKNDLYKNDRDMALYHPLRLAAADYWNDATTQDILKKYFEHSAASIFTKAKDKANPLVLRGYEALPDVVKQYGDCAKGVCTGAGIGIVAHIGCIAKFGILPLVGASSALTANPSLTFGLMTGLSAGGIGLWQYMHNKRGSVPSRLEKITTYGATIAAFGIALTAHAEHIMPDSDHDAKPKTTLYTDDTGQEFLIRRNVICTGFGAPRVVQDTIPLYIAPSPAP